MNGELVELERESRKYHNFIELRKQLDRDMTIV